MLLPSVSSGASLQLDGVAREVSACQVVQPANGWAARGTGV